MDSPEPEPPSAYAARPDYRVDLLARTNLMTAKMGLVLLASSDQCLVVDEQDHGLVVYFPPDSVDFSLLEPVDRSYPTPYPQVARIAGYVAFDQGTVSVAIGTGRFTGVRP